MREYLVDDRSVFDGRNDSGLAAAGSTFFYINVEDPLESRCPVYGHMTVACCFLLVQLSCVSALALAPLCRRDQGSVFAFGANTPW